MTPDLNALFTFIYRYSGNRFLGPAPGLAPALGNGLASIEKKKSSNVGVLVGVIVGAVLVVGIVLGILVCFIRSRGKKPRPGPGPNPVIIAPPGKSFGTCALSGSCVLAVRSYLC